MKCITSPALDDTQIVSYIEGEADDTVVTHINECLFCSERANRWSLLQNRLRKKIYRVTCPTPTELGDYHLRMLPASQVLLVAQHVRECPLCTRELARLENFLAEPAQEDRIFGKAKILIAQLISSGTDESASTFAALRGEAKGPLILEADGIVILLDIQQAENGVVNILGQVAVEDQDQWTGAVVELHQEGKLESSTIVDDLGAFHSKGIISGSKELRIISKDNSLSVISNFEVST